MKDFSGGESALAGVGVLDLAGERASFGSRLLADLGARVIKVEEPGGDPARRTGLHAGDPPGENPFFHFNNMNKLGITLNLRAREGRNLFLKLVRGNDIIIESCPPGTMAALDLGPETLRAENPSIVIVSVTGFGESGPRKNYLACDLVASAFGGQMFICGEEGKPPLKPFGCQSYYSASLFAAVAALVGLRERRKGGSKLRFDLSLQEVVVGTLEHVMIRYFNEQRVAEREGRLHWEGGFCISPCRDGFILLTLFHEWPTLVGWMESEHMAEDLVEEKWAEEAYRRKHIAHVIEVIARWTQSHSTQDLYEMGQTLRLPWAPVRSPADTLRCPQLKARGFFMDVGPFWGNRHVLKCPGHPCSYGMPVPKKWRPPPGVGEHNHQVYHEELGIPFQELDRLRSLGVI